MNPQKLMNALPAYKGGKRRLIPWIFYSLNQVLPYACWSELTFIDAFMGGGSVSIHAKACGFGELHCNDWSYRSQLIFEGLIANQSTRLLHEDLLRLFYRPEEQEKAGFVETTYGGEVFSHYHARLLDIIAGNTVQFASLEKQALSKLLQWHLIHQFVAFGTSIGNSNRPFSEVIDGKRDWWTLNPKRLNDGSFKHMLASVWPVAKRLQLRLNAGILESAGPVYGYRMDTFDFVQKANGHILYLDPPYAGTSGYEKENEILDAVLCGKRLEEPCKSSPFSKGTESLSDLLAQCRHIPVWILSYGNKVIDENGLVALVEKLVPKRTVLGWSKQYKHLSHVTKNQGNQELLVLAVDKSFTKQLGKEGVR